ncbi:ECF transporter S component [uncultured Clostridium sp.]|uniref:ECF transporter S component n=1 Tax=uncultured Clostridium sp. TaxID=59620 RepID=UPI00261CFD01|nr:ECF transporter S component [uncultured Clostridium sp.]
MNKYSAKQIVKISLFSAISFILMFLNTSIPLFPIFLKVDISEIPAIIMVLTGGVNEAIFISLIKDLLHFTVTQTSGVGELINFILSASFILITHYLYNKTKKIKISLLLSTIIISIFSGFVNYFIMFPLYSILLGVTKQMVLRIVASFNPFVTNVTLYLILIIIPFNLIKFGIVSIISYNLLNKIKGVLKK